MRILFLTPYLPYPPTKGTALRNLYIIRSAARSHSVHLLTFGTEADTEGVDLLGRDLDSIEIVAPPDRSMLKRLAGLPSPLPDLASRLRSPEFQSKLEKALGSRGFDLVQVEGLEMGPYALEVCRSRGSAGRPMVLYDAHNAEYALQRSAYRADLNSPARWPGAAYSFLQWRKLRDYEREVCRRANALLAVSEADAIALRSLDPELNPRVVPNGVDTATFDCRSQAGGPARNGTTLVFTGTLDYRPNVDAAVWFCHQVLPLVRRGCPEVEVLLVGRDPAPAVRGLAGPGVTVTGPVEDVRPYLQRSSIFVAPLRMGSGTRLKILEAMACGLPVVSTRIGIEGIAATSGQEALVADDPQGFAACILELLADDTTAQSLATRARLLVEHRYDWKAILPALTEVYEDFARHGKNFT